MATFHKSHSLLCNYLKLSQCHLARQGFTEKRPFSDEKTAKNCWKFIALQFPHLNHYHQPIISTLKIVKKITTMQLLRGPIIKVLQKRNRQNYESNQLFLCLSIALVRGNLCDRCFCTNDRREKARMSEPWTELSRIGCCSCHQNLHCHLPLSPFLNQQLL